MLRLVLTGAYDGALEHVLRGIGVDLDISEQLMSVLLAYAADVACDAVHQGDEDVMGLAEVPGVASWR